MNIPIVYVQDQLELLILLMVKVNSPDYNPDIHPSDNMMRVGFTQNNLKVFVAENRKLWFKVGEVSEKKEFDERMLKVLSTLSNKGDDDITNTCFSRKKYYGDSVYTVNKNHFEPRFIELLKQVTEKLEFDYSQDVICTSKDELIKMLKAGTLEVSSLNRIEDSEQQLFSEEQLLALAHFEIKYLL